MSKSRSPSRGSGEQWSRSSITGLIYSLSDRMQQKSFKPSRIGISPTVLSDTSLTLHYSHRPAVANPDNGTICRHSQQPAVWDGLRPDSEDAWIVGPVCVNIVRVN